MGTLTVEATARVLGKFNITFTTEGVRTLVQKKLLKTVPRHNSHIIRGSRYNYGIDLESLVAMLRNKGISDSDIKDALDM
jgi:hypothetical protein